MQYCGRVRMPVFMYIEIYHKMQDLPEDWNCPVCGAEKKMFQSRQKEIAGFAENQGYGLGTNSMTAEQKNLLIFGSLAGFFVLFLLGYAMN